MSSYSASGNYLFATTAPVGVEIYGTDSTFALLIYDQQSDGSYLPSTAYRTTFKMNKVDENADPCLVSHAGADIFLDGELSGNGKIICGGALTFQGRSVLDADRDSGLSLYARGTVTVNPSRGSGGTADPNGALRDAWDAFLGAAGGTGYTSTGYRKYSELRNALMEQSISTGTYAGKTLRQVLTDGAFFSYDRKEAEELVTQMLGKNSYTGEPPAGSGTTDYHGSHTDSDGVITMTTAGGYTINMCNRTGTNQNYVGLSVKKNGNDQDIYQIASNGTITQVQDKNNVSSGLSGSNTTYWGTFSLLLNGTLTVNVTLSSSTWLVSVPDSGTNPVLDADTIQMRRSGDGAFQLLNFNDTVIKGLVYTWEDLYCPDMGGGSFTVRGGIVAYGGNPATDDPGTNQKGKITVCNSRGLIFSYDPTLMSILLCRGDGVLTRRRYSASF